MKYLKKTLSFVLAFAMAFTMVIVPRGSSGSVADAATEEVRYFSADMYKYDTTSSTANFNTLSQQVAKDQGKDSKVAIQFNEGGSFNDGNPDYNKWTGHLDTDNDGSENNENKEYSWQDLRRVKIGLYFEKGGAWHQGLHTLYVMQFSFIFQDGFEFIIDMGKSVEENPKMAYQILRNKNIDIQASDEVIDFFEQNELKLYDFFENIYHKNGKNR